MVKRRGTRGVGKLGCLLGILLVAGILFYGIPGIEIYWDYYKLRDEMKRNARFAETQTDAMIVASLRTTVDELGLPRTARRFVVRRTERPRSISIRTEYADTLTLPFTLRVFHLRPAVTVPY